MIDDGTEDMKKTLTDSLLACSSVPINSSEPTPIKPPNSQALAMAALGMMWGGIIPLPKKKAEKTLQKCGLKECNVMTTKDFCCAEHCKAARAKQKS